MQSIWFQTQALPTQCALAGIDFFGFALEFSGKFRNVQIQTFLFNKFSFKNPILLNKSTILCNFDRQSVIISEFGLLIKALNAYRDQKLDL